MESATMPPQQSDQSVITESDAGAQTTELTTPNTARTTETGGEDVEAEDDGQDEVENADEESVGEKGNSLEETSDDTKDKTSSDEGTPLQQVTTADIHLITEPSTARRNESATQKQQASPSGQEPPSKRKKTSKFFYHCGTLPYFKPPPLPKDVPNGFYLGDLVEYTPGRGFLDNPETIAMLFSRDV